MVLLIHRVNRSLVKCPRMDGTADHPHESGVIAAGAVLLLAGVLGILLPVIALIVGIPVFCTGLLSRREAPPSVKKPLGTVPPD